MINSFASHKSMIVYNGCCVDAGASLNIRDDEGETALGIAQDHEKRRIVEILTAAGDYHDACGM